MTTSDTYEGWIGRTAVDRDGEKIGSITDIYYDDVTGEPAWVTVKSGLLGTKSTFVPMEGADRRGDDLSFPYEKSKIKDAPNLDDDGSLSPEEERELYAYYGQQADFDRDVDKDQDISGTVGHDTSGPTTDNAMTRSEEELSVGKQSRETGSARLRKYVVTEEKQVTVPVERAEASGEVRKEQIEVEGSDDRQR